MKRTNDQWLADLRASGLQQGAALEDLRAIILSGLPYALSGWLSPDSPELAALTEEVAQETLLRVLDRLDTFEGRSQFTTWVHKIAVHRALTELRRRRWQEVPLDELVGEEADTEVEDMLADSSAGPESLVERRDLLARLSRLISEELTQKQRQAVVAVAIQGMPMDEVAQRMGMQRNALYKLIHDARLRLKRRMEAEGLSPQELLAVIEER